VEVLACCYLDGIVVTIGIALTTLYSRQSSTVEWICIAVVLGSGMGIIFPSLHTASDIVASREGRTRQAVTNFMFFQLLGKVFGLGIATTVFQNRFRKLLTSSALFRDRAEAYTQDSVALMVKLRTTPGVDSRTRLEMADVYVSSLKTVWIFLAVVAGLALFSSFLIISDTHRKTRRVESNLMSDGYVV
jgi:hypothetical protein